MTKLLKQEGTARRTESMQKSSAIPKTRDVGRGLWNPLNPPRSAFLFWHGVIPTPTLICILVSPTISMAKTQYPGT